MLEVNKIFILGYFGYNSKKLDGQTVKTREIHNLFEKKIGKKIHYFDTEQLKESWIHFISLILGLQKSEILLYLPAQNNLKRFFPILYPLSKIFRFRIHYFVVGGWLPEFISQNPSIGNKLKKIQCIYVETHKMLTVLNNKNEFSNVVWFPNFRVDQKAKRTIQQSKSLRIVFLSRITLEKGVDTIFKYLDSITNDSLYKKISIDFYGPVDSALAHWFLSKLEEHSNTRYVGQVEPESVQSVLCNYDLMLFPTRYPGEGCPGAIIDAYMASLPVIASNWKYNSEFIDEGSTGFIIDFNKDFIELNKHLKMLMSDVNLLNTLKANAYKKSLDYTECAAWDIAIRQMT